MRQLLHKLKSDESLMLAYKGGDSSAFETLYLRYKNQLFGFLNRQCPAGIVEELAQDIWMAVIDSASRYEVQAKFKTYLYQIAHYKLIDYWRRQKATQEPLDVDTLIDKYSTSQEKSYSYKVLIQAIRQLPAEQRDSFLLREEGFSHEDIAEITDCGKETVKSRLRYATQTLRQQFEVSQ